MSSISTYNKKNGSTWYAVHYRDNGGGQHKKRGFRTKRDAEAFKLHIDASKTNNTYVSPSAQRTSMRDLIVAYVSTTAGLAPNTVAQRQSHAKNKVMPKWGTWQVGRITRPDVEKWVQDMVAAGEGASTIEKAHAILVAVLHRAVDQNLIGRNPATGVRLPRQKKAKHPYLTFEEVRELADAIDPRYRTLVVFLAVTGLRFGEAVALTVGSLDLEARRASVTQAIAEVNGVAILGSTKTHENRRVAFPPFLVQGLLALVDGKRRDDYVFTGPEGGILRLTSWRKRQFYPAISRVNAARAAKVAATARVIEDFPKVTPHDLRHTAASLAVKAGANVKVVQKMLGHADAKMTLNTYADLFDTDLDEVADALGDKIAQSSLANMFDDHAAGIS